MPTQDQTSSPSKSWLRVKITANCEIADLIADLVCRQTGGAEQIQAPAGDKTRELIVGYLANDADTQKKLLKITRDLAELPMASDQTPMTLIETEIIPDEDWNSAWKERFHPLSITTHLVIKPTWESYQPGPAEKVIELDPGMAFGTGHHASTRLALELIEDLFHGKEIPPDTVLDVGTGTGILAMAAALFGAGEVQAIDNDPEAVAVARENIRLNGLQPPITASETSLEEIRGQFTLVIANIIHDTLIDLAADLDKHVAPKGRLILAGILTGPQTDSICATYASLGLEHQETKSEGEWSAILFAKP